MVRDRTCTLTQLTACFQEIQLIAIARPVFAGQRTTTMKHGVRNIAVDLVLFVRQVVFFAESVCEDQLVAKVGEVAAETFVGEVSVDVVDVGEVGVVIEEGDARIAIAKGILGVDDVFERNGEETMRAVNEGGRALFRILVAAFGVFLGVFEHAGVAGEGFDLLAGLGEVEARLVEESATIETGDGLAGVLD